MDTSLFSFLPLFHQPLLSFSVAFNGDSTFPCLKTNRPFLPVSMVLCNANQGLSAVPVSASLQINPHGHASVPLASPPEPRRAIITRSLTSSTIANSQTPLRLLLALLLHPPTHFTVGVIFFLPSHNAWIPARVQPSCCFTPFLGSPPFHHSNCFRSRPLHQPSFIPFLFPLQFLV